MRGQGYLLELRRLGKDDPTLQPCNRYHLMAGQQCARQGLKPMQSNHAVNIVFYTRPPAACPAEDARHDEWMLHGAAGIDALVGTKSIATFCHRAQLLRLRHLVAACLIMIWCFLASLSQAQPAAEDHLKHHPDPDATLQPDTPVQPSAGDMMQSMGGMMEGMFQLPPKALYPSLMELPELTPEKQDELQAAAQDRIQSGMGMTSEGHDQLVIARRSGDLSAMQQALRMLEEGTAILRSGVATQRAIAERDTPQDIALNWFRAEMNLNASAREEVPGLFGVSWFHFSVMVGLFVSVSAMLWLYFGKMQRASQLLQSLTGVGDADSVHAVQPQVHEDMLTGAPATTGAASQASKKSGLDNCAWDGYLAKHRTSKLFVLSTHSVAGCRLITYPGNL